MKIKRNLFFILKQFSKYSILNGIEALVPFAFLIILTRSISPQDYGIWALFVSLYSFVIPLIGGRLDDAIRMYYNDLDLADIRKFIVSSFVITSFLSGILMIITYLFRDPISFLINIPSNWLLAIIIAAYVSAIFEIIRAVLQFRNEVKLIMYMVILKVASILLFTFILLQHDLKYGAPIIGTILGTAVAIGAVFLLYSPLKFLKFRLYFGKKFYKKLLGFFLVYLPSGFGLIVIPLTDRLIISHFANIQETGLYSIASLYGNVVANLITGAFILAWTPWLFNNLNKKTNESIKSIKIISTCYYLCMPIIGIIIWQLSEILSSILVTKDFANADSYVALLITAAVFQSYFLHNQTFLHYLKKSYQMSLSMTIIVISNIILSYLGVIYFGVTGVAYATIFSYILGSIISAILAKYFFNKLL